MTINQLLPFISTAVMLWFTVDVFKRYLVRRNPAFLFWAIGLAKSINPSVITPMAIKAIGTNFSKKNEFRGMCDLLFAFV